MDTKEPGLIHEKLVAIMEEIGHIGKTRRAPKQAGGFPYRGIDDVLQEVQPLLVKHKVTVDLNYEIANRNANAGRSGNDIATVLLLSITLTAEDGSSRTSRVPGEGQDNRDKSIPKACSGAYKYFWFQAMCIPTNEPKDAEGDGEDDRPPRRQQKPPAPSSKPQQRRTVDSARASIQRKVFDWRGQQRLGDNAVTNDVFLTNVCKWLAPPEGLTTVKACDNFDRDFGKEVESKSFYINTGEPKQ